MRNLRLLPTTTLILCCLLFLTGHVSAAPLFPNPVYPVGPNPYGMGMADFNRDGIQDLAVANFGQGYDGGPGDLSILLGHGDGTFAEEYRVPTSQHPSDVLAADLNGDGNGDLVVTYYASGYAVWMPGHGDGTFGPESGIASNVIRLVWADINHDAFPDLLEDLAASGQVCFRALIGQGDGTFATEPAVCPGSVESSTPLDLNGDGWDDVATILNPDLHTVLIFLGTGDGGFVAAGDLTFVDEAFGLSGADLDGDGLDDLAVRLLHPHDSGFNQDVQYFFSAGDGSFIPGALEQEADLVAVVASDRNGDGIQDYVRVGEFDVHPYLGQGSRTYAALPFFYSGSDNIRVVTSDFDGDGHADLALSSNFSEAVFVYAGHANGTFGPPVDPTLRDTYIGGVVTDDFDGDGLLDIAATALYQDQVAIKLGHGDGTFAAETRFFAGTAPLYLASADMNGDGRKDLVVIARHWYDSSPVPFPPEDIEILIGNGDGTFQPPAAYSDPGLLSVAMHVRDVDGDGAPDVVVATGTDDTQSKEPDLSYFHNNGDGTLNAVGHLSVGAVIQVPYGWTFPMNVDSGDLDHDGVRDLVVAVSGLPYASPVVPGAVRVLRGLGGGLFEAPIDIGTGINPADVTVADIDGDGVPDVSVADPAAYIDFPPGPGGLFTLRNDGAGAFSQSALMKAGIGPFDVQVTDMTDDGILDLVGTNNAGYVAILPGLGNGAFGPAMNFGLFGAPLALVAGDFNGDHLRDMLVVSSSGIFVLQNLTQAPPPLQIAARLSLSSPAGKGSGTVTWTTNAESDLLGFNVVQITNQGRSQVNAALIPCEQCSSGRGAAYATIIPKHKSGKSIFIEAVHADHTVETFGPAVKP
jgi:hypothetical protein